MPNPLHRAALRSVQQQAAPSATSFVGAHHSRLTEDWIFAAIKSADAEIKGDIRTLRKRGREIKRNTATGERFVQLLKTNVIGPHGIRFQSRPLDEMGEYDRDAARDVEDAWRRWSDPGVCTADGKMSWHDVEDLLVESEAADGEAILRLLPGFRNDFGFAIQVLDPDQLDEEYNRPARGSKNEIRMGVEIDRWGRPLAYHLWDTHPFDFQGSSRRERVRVPADQILHPYRIRRAGQSRGVTWFAPVLMDARMLAALQEAEIIASRQAAAKTGVFEQEASSVLDPNSPSGSAESFEWEMAPGVWETLPPGLKAKFFDPTHPNQAFEAFNKIILHSNAAGLGPAYESLTGDFSDTNYSSARQATLTERDLYRALQARAAVHVHRRVFAMWQKWALTTGAIDRSMRERERLLRHEWVPRGWQWVDPEKEVRAAALSIRLGIDSRTRIAAEQGRDLEEVMDELAREARMAEERGLELTTDVSRGAAGGEDGRGADGDYGSRIAALTNGNGRS